MGPLLPALLLVFAGSGLIAQQAGEKPAGKEWPRKFVAPDPVWEAERTAKGWVYRTRSYEIHSPVGMERNHIAGLARTAESVAGVLEQFPLRLVQDGPGGRKREIVRIYRTQDDYLASGAPKGSVGFFSGRTGEVAVSLPFLLQPNDPRWKLPPRQRFRLLVHELVHQAQRQRLTEIPVWMAEGIAEYFAANQTLAGTYDFENSPRNIVAHLRNVWPPAAKNAEARVPGVETLAKFTYGGWMDDNRVNGVHGFGKYAGSLLLVHYFMELAARDKGGLAEFLEAKGRREVRQGPDGRRYLVFVPPDTEVLWRDRSPAEIEKALVRYWSTKGLRLRFGK